MSASNPLEFNSRAALCRTRSHVRKIVLAWVKTRPVAERVEVGHLLGDDIMRSPETERSPRLVELERTALEWHLAQSLSSHTPGEKGNSPQLSTQPKVAAKSKRRSIAK